MNLFHATKVGLFLYAFKFFSYFLIEIWRQKREYATKGKRGFWICRVNPLKSPLPFLIKN